MENAKILEPYYRLQKADSTSLLFWPELKYISFSHGDSQLTKFIDELLKLNSKRQIRNMILNKITELVSQLVQNHLDKFGDTIAVITQTAKLTYISDGTKMIPTNKFDYKVLANGIPLDYWSGITNKISINISSFRDQLLSNLINNSSYFLFEDRKYNIEFNTKDQELIEYEIKTKDLPDLQLNGFDIYWSIYNKDELYEA